MANKKRGLASFKEKDDEKKEIQEIADLVNELPGDKRRSLKEGLKLGRVLFGSEDDG